ncbi:early endosome antigen 1 [Antennarius striatus]|uniref:early endosome antigen 1 n=1 Tax=Antennarius striatus TaxID=241820 RepID=UPI0035B29BF7
MMSKSPSRWPETVVNSKTNKSTQNARSKERAAATVPLFRGGTQASSSKAKSSVINGRRSSLSSRGTDPTAPGSKAAGTLKRSSVSHQGSVCDQGTRASRLSSSRSFSSLHTSSLTRAPFIRGSRSLSRLDQRPADAVPGSQVKKQIGEKTVLNSDKLSSKEQISDQKDQCCDNTEEMEMESHSTELWESSSSVDLTSKCHHHCNNVKKQGKDGMYTVCAMASGKRHNWLQEVLKNVRPGLTFDLRSSLPEQTPPQKPEQPDSPLAEGQEKTEPSTIVCVEKSHPQQKEKELGLHPEREQSTANGSSASPMISSSYLSSSIHPPLSLSPTSQLCPQSEGEGASKPLDAATQIDESDALLCTAKAETTSSTLAELLPDDKKSNIQNETEQQDKLINIGCECRNMKDKSPCMKRTGQLVKELEQMQKELCRLQQLNKNLQDELHQEKESHSREWIHPQNELLSNPSDQVLAFQLLQKMNHNLRCELEAQKADQDEAREDELRQRIDLLAQQAQLLVAGDPTGLVHVHAEQDHQRFLELELEWERRVASLKSQLSVSEEQRKGTELQLTQLQHELQSFQSLQQEADCLKKHLQEATAQLHSNEEAQAQKEVRLQKHLTLLQESQDRERKSLAANLAQAEQHSIDLQERLERAEEQLENLSKAQTTDTEKAQRQLQEELAYTISALQTLQEERDRLSHHCQELQNQFSEADGELSRLHSRLKTDEAHYYNLEHSYETVCEERQLAMGRVQEKESEIQDIREGYERLLDRKEQELREVLLKMEVLGNSLEETELQLNEVLKVCTCSSSGLTNEPPEPALKNKRQGTADLLTVTDGRPKALAFGPNSSVAKEDTIQPSYQNNVAAAGDPEQFISVIKLLETKLYLTEEKLRDIMQKLEEQQGHVTCQDPHLCSQLTQSRATAQHLSLLLYNQAKQSQHFAQDTEEHYRMLIGRFQVALNIIQGCKERLQFTPINIMNIEKQLSTAAACLHQGQRDAEKQQLKSHKASKTEDKILRDGILAGAGNNITSESKLNNALPSGGDSESVGRYLMKELFVVEQMASVLQSQYSIEKLTSVTGDCDGDARSYKRIMAHRLLMKSEERIQFGRTDCDNHNAPLNEAITRVCAEAELIHAALKFQHEKMIHIKNQEVEHQQNGLADISPPELAPYDEQVQVQNKGSQQTAKVEKEESVFRKVETDKAPEWLERLITRLHKRAKYLRQLFQEISDVSGVECNEEDDWEKVSASELNQMKEQVRLIYLWDRLHLDLEPELKDSEMLQEKLPSLCKEQDFTLNDKEGASNHILHQLQDENSELREKLEHADQKIVSTETVNQRLLEDIQKIKDHHEERMQKVERECQEQTRELQQIHEEEMKHLHGCNSKDCSSVEKQTKTCPVAPAFTGNTSSRPDQTGMTRQSMEDLGNRMTSGEEGFSAMEEMHNKLIDELQHQHQMEVAALLKEKDQLLQEETAATMTAIVAMGRAHRQELKGSQLSALIKDSEDITHVDMEYEKETRLLQKELELLSFQHTQKCLENSQLTQQLENERQTFMQCQTENQELKNKQVTLRVREAEMQLLRQEAHSLKEELKMARMDKLHAQNKLKALYSGNQDEPHHDVKNLCGETKFATWSPSRRSSGQRLEDIVTNTGDSVSQKKTEKSSLTHQIRGVRSKSLKDGLSVQERMRLFESF